MAGNHLEDGRREMARETTINHEEIQRLSQQLFEDDTRQSFLRIAQQVSAISKTNAWMHGYQATVEPLRGSMSRIDEAIGGVGIDKLLVSTADAYTGGYPKHERSIYRPLQYALILMLHTNDPRFSIQMSCEHIEGIMKRTCRKAVPNINLKPLGSIVGDVKNRSLLESGTIQNLKDVAHIVNIAKHDYGIDAIRISDSMDRVQSQVFNTHEAVSMYFVCRKIGVQLLSDYPT